MEPYQTCKEKVKLYQENGFILINDQVFDKRREWRKYFKIRRPRIYCVDPMH